MPRLPDLSAKVRSIENRRARQASDYMLHLGKRPRKMNSHRHRPLQPPIPALMLRWHLNQPYHHLLKPRRPLKMISTLPRPQTFGRKQKNKQGDTTFECFTGSSTRAILSSWFWMLETQKAVEVALSRKKSDVERARGRNSSSC